MKKLVALIVVVLILGSGFYFYYWQSPGPNYTYTPLPSPLPDLSATVTPSTSVLILPSASPVRSVLPTPTPTPAPTSGERVFTMQQVRAHNSAASCYVVISDGVYDLTSYVDQHPGGPDRILNICGTDATAAFTAQHGGQPRPANELAGFKIGRL